MGKNFYLAGASLIAIFTASSTVIPQLGEIQSKLSLGIDALAIVAVSYFAGSCTALLFLSRISNSIGRKKATIIGLALALISCIILYVFTNATQVYIARFLQGLGTGIATSAVMSYIIDSVSEQQRSFAATFNVCGPGVGFLLGSAASIVLIKYTNLNPLIVFLAIASLTFILIFLIALVAKETIDIDYSTLGRNLVPKIEVPKEYRIMVFLASLIFVFCWLIGGFFQAFLPVLINNNFGYDNSMIGIVFIVLMVPQTCGGFVVKNMHATKAFLWCFSLFVLNTIAFIFATYYSVFSIFLICTFLAGGLASAATSAAMSFAVAPTQIQERAGIIAAIFLMGFLGAGIPNFIMGQLSNSMDFNTILLFYPVMAIIGLCLVFMTYYFGIHKPNLVKN